ncbi:MAG: UDP-N-acetylmuramoyl-tripeptide--D-alanyl-D-alanine ligase [Acidimicrobiales bacterium]
MSRLRLPAPAIGVTGSVGKTSVKHMIAAATSAAARTHANAASFNNELGLPLTLANAPDDTQVTVVEMGARGIGHIRDLCEIARPTIGVVTKVALAHSELFGSIEGVAAAKGELVEALPPDGVAVLHAGDPHVRSMASRSVADVIFYGDPRADVYASDVHFDELLRGRFVVTTPAGSADVRLAVSGAHMVDNAVGAIAAGTAAGLDLASLVAGLERAVISRWRMEIDRTASGGIVINDAYNANPTSMRAALAALSALDVARRVAVVGVMAELGEEGPAEHLAIADEALAAGIDVIAVNAPAYGPRVRHVSDAVAAIAAVARVGDGDAVLVKGSRSAGLEQIAAILLA